MQIANRLSRRGSVNILRSMSSISSVKPSAAVPASREPLLFTPGPLTTSYTVKQAMLRDLGSRDDLFLKYISEIQTDLLAAAHTSREAGYECVIMQGSGTFAVESVITSTIPRENAKLLVVTNGAYGHRMQKIADTVGIPTTSIEVSERERPTVEAVLEAVRADKSITHVGLIHHETTSGILNEAADICKALKALPDNNITTIVDSMSGFGAYDIDVGASGVDFLVSSANKCIEGVPGFAFAIARRSVLEACEGVSRSVSLDLHAQWVGLNNTGQFRFTPPTHAILAFHQALQEFKAEGGVAGRHARYQANFEALKAGMREMGFELYLDEDSQGCIISTFLFPDDSNFDFPQFYRALQDRGLVIYPGKLTKADCFRLGSIGRLYPRDMQAVVTAIRDVLTDMGVSLPVKQIAAAE